MNVKCSNCGTEDDINNMIEITPSRVQYFCWACYKLGHGEAHLAEVDRGKRLERYKHVMERKKK